MDTINRVVNAASTALWGEDDTKSKDIPHGDEPMSGVQGKGIANDPYDAGNRDEQPDAPISDGNTAPQEPKLDGTPLNAPTETTTAAAGGSGSSEAPQPKPTAQPEQRSTEQAPEKPKETESESPKETESPKPSSNTQQASTEALKGPQGPAPKPAEEFEKEMKGQKKSKALQEKSEKSEPSAEAGAPASKPNDQASNASGSDKSTGSGNGSGKHSTMAKMKERLNKVAHPRHGNSA